MESNVANVHTSVCEVCGLLHGVTTKPPSCPPQAETSPPGSVLWCQLFAGFLQTRLPEHQEARPPGAWSCHKETYTRERVATARMVEAAQYQLRQRQTASCLAHLFREKAASARLLQPAQIPFACCASGKMSLFHKLLINMRYHKVWLTQCR